MPLRDFLGIFLGNNKTKTTEYNKNPKNKEIGKEEEEKRAQKNE